MHLATLTLYLHNRDSCIAYRFRREDQCYPKMIREDELASAAATGNTELVRILIENGIDVNAVNSFGQTPLQVMMMGNTAIARILLEYGAQPNILDIHTGSTPLHDAARGGFLDTVELLIQYHADVHAMDYKGRRPVDLAKTNGHQDVVALLESV